MKIILFAVVLLSACSSQKMIRYTVETNPRDAIIDVNGVNLCTQTPCEIQLECKRRWVGLAYSSSGYAGSSVYTVEALPRARGLQSQRKIVDACQTAEDVGGRIYMDMELERVAPRSVVDVNVR